MKLLRLCIVLTGLAGTGNCFADTPAFAVTSISQVIIAATNPPSYAPAVLPGSGLAQHPFLYTGEWDYRKTNQTIFVVRGGKVVWTYDIPIKTEDGTLQEFSDATMLSNGNILFARKTGAGEITPDKKLIWNYDGPKGTEIHVVQPLGTNRVMFVQSGDPAKLFIMDITARKTEKELVLPVPQPVKSPHLQFRRVRETGDGTFLAAHLNDNKVVEYDADGKAVWSYKVKGPWCAVRLRNGNTLTASYPSTVLEVNPKGETVWEFGQKDVPDIKLFIVQGLQRLANGNTVICSWCPMIKNTNDWPKTVQVLEVTPEKKVVWALKSWDEPANFGPASTLQLLDEPGIPENPGDQQR